MQEKRIAVVRFSALGDVLLLWPVVEAVARNYPTYKISFFTRLEYIPHLPQNPGIQVVGLDFKDRHSGIVSQFFFWWGWLRSTYPEVWVDAHAHLRTLLPTWLAKRFGARISRLNKHRSERRAFLQGKISVLPSVQASYAEQFTKVGFPISWPLERSMGKDREVNSVLLLAPFSAQPTKCMPLSTAYSLANRWMKTGGTVVLLGSSEERASWVGPIVKQISQHEEWTYWTTAAAAIVTDSANQHLAALHGIPSVTVWAGTSPRAGFSPHQNTAHMDVEPEGLDCHPCSIYGKSTCLRGDFACKTTPVQKIWDALVAVARTELPLSC